jgi:hypothetical protein
MTEMLPAQSELLAVPQWPFGTAMQTFTMLMQWFYQVAFHTVTTCGAVRLRALHQ